MRTVVVYVHGLWFSGGESLLLRHRLKDSLGAQCRVFAYPSMSGSLSEAGAGLSRFLLALDADTVHVVGHSMGGIVILKAFESIGAARLPGSSLQPGRVVLTGAPVRGSRSAQRLARLPWGRRLLGRTGREALLSTGEPRWCEAGRELGVIAGDLGVGLGRLLGGMGDANDGTVWVSETDLPGARSQIRLPVSHTGLVLSRTVANQVAAFLRFGRFTVS